MSKKLHPKLHGPAWPGAALILLLLIIAACLPAQKVSILNVRPLTGEPQVQVNGELGITVDMDNPGNLPLSYEWTASEGTFRPLSETARSAIYMAPGHPGTQRITIRARQAGKVVGEGYIDVEVAAAATSTPAVARPAWCVPSTGQSISDAQLQGKVRITFPQDCSEVSYVNIFTGTYADVPDDVDIWILVYPPNGRYYPQSDSAFQGRPVDKDDGKWRQTIYLGTPSSGPDQFDVIVVLASREAGQFFGEKLKTWAQYNSFPGLTRSELPKGLTEVQTVTLKRVR